MTSTVMPGCSPVSHRGGSSVGVVVLHGFTGNPSSMRGVADALIAAGYDLELPRLPGHGTTIDEMVETGWTDWFAETERVLDEIGERVDDVVVVGQSAGGTLALAAALGRPEIVGVVCINPATCIRDEATMEMLDSLIDDGIVPITDRFGELTIPLRLFTSRQDHVVPPSDSEHLAATWGGPVEHTWLERSYHVATLDFDRDTVIGGTIDFVRSLEA